MINRHQRRKQARKRRKRGAMSLMHPSAVAGMDQAKSNVLDALTDCEAKPMFADFNTFQIGCIMAYALQGPPRHTQGDLALRIGVTMGEINRLQRLIGHLDPAEVQSPQLFDELFDQRFDALKRIENRFEADAEAARILANSVVGSDTSDDETTATFVQIIVDKYGAKPTESQIIGLSHHAGHLFGQAIRLRRRLRELEDIKL